MPPRKKGQAMKKEYDITYCVYDIATDIRYEFDTYDEAEKWAKENLKENSYLIIKKWYEEAR